MRTLNADGANDVGQAYSPPRITKMARAMGLHAGWALDMVETDPGNNQPWDFVEKNKTDEALRNVKEDKCFMLIVIPCVERLCVCGRSCMEWCGVRNEG